jgi:hypothetical protein
MHTPTIKISLGEYAVAQWLRHYPTNRKVASSIPDEVIFYIYLILQAALGHGVSQPLTGMITRNRKIMFLGSKVGPVRRADNLTVICEPIV